MTPERWREIREVLHEALEIELEERSAYLDRACAADSSLRGEVESLLASSDEARSSFLESPPLAQVPLSKGTKLGDYEVVSLLGSGGMGEVYRARDPRLGREVAVKVLPSSVSADPERLRRFEQEARAAAALNHPNILAVFQMGTYQGAPYLVSELLEGETLREQTKRGSMPARKTMDYGVQMARGLAAAHEKGIVHRDLKPENVFVTRDGRVKILDFGLARLVRRKATALSVSPALSHGTEPGVVMGTVGYMSPEQVRGEAADCRSDMFSFGAVLYEMLAGKRAFQRATAVETMSAVLNEDPPGISQLIPTVAPGLERVVHRCLEKKPEQRFQSASDLAFALESLSDWSGASTVARSSGSKRARVALRVGILTLVVAALAVVTLFGFNILGLRDRVLGGAPSARIQSLAVLPLANLSGDPAQEYFSDGMTDALITDLSQIGSLKVISRTSVMHYKKTDKTLPEIARELSVDGIVEGTVQRSGDHVRITAQLIEGPTDKNLWAKSYERDMRDAFALEADVTGDISRQVQARVTSPNQAPRAQPPRLNPKALDAYLQGHYHLRKGGMEFRDKELRTAGECFQQAIDAAPDFALAYVGLAEAHHILSWPSSEDFAVMRRAAGKAVALDPVSSEARAELGFTKFDDFDWSGAEEEYRRAITLNPNNAFAHDHLGWCLDAMGRLEEGWKEFETAQELDPNQDHLSSPLYRRGDYDRSIEVLQKELESRPGDPDVHYALSSDYALKGMYKEWIRELSRAVSLMGFPESGRRIQQAFAVSGRPGALHQWARELERWAATKQDYSPCVLAQVYTSLGDKDRAFYWLGQGVDHNHMAMHDDLQWFKAEPELAPLRSDPRFKDLLRRAGLPP